MLNPRKCQKSVKVATLQLNRIFHFRFLSILRVHTTDYHEKKMQMKDNACFYNRTTHAGFVMANLSNQRLANPPADKVKISGLRNISGCQQTQNVSCLGMCVKQCWETGMQRIKGTEHGRGQSTGSTRRWAGVRGGRKEAEL